MTEITVDLVKKLIDLQFPQWSDLSLTAVKNQGNDNRTFHLGSELLVRLPSAVGYAPQTAREQKWLPYLAKKLPLPIPMPVALGQPSEAFPFAWSINRYLEGESANVAEISDLAEFAHDLGTFLYQLQRIDAKDGPAANAENCFRGANLLVYQEETHRALASLKSELPTDKLRQFWEEAIINKWDQPNVWVHGDIAPGNLLVKDGKLSAVIDFGIMAVGDPACDLAMGWTFFDTETRKIFFEASGADEAMIARGRGWALWKALITYPHEPLAHRTLIEILKD